MTGNAHERALLTAQLEKLQARAVKLEAELEALVRTRRNASDDDEHDPEGETLSAQWSMRSGLLDAAQHDVAQAEDAIRRFDSGEYGICRECHKPIPFAQLEVRPFREYCVKCASKKP